MNKPTTLANFPLLLFLSLLLQFLSSTPANLTIPVHDPNSILLTFGSAFSPKAENPGSIFDSITSLNPDVFIWVGNAAYVDSRWLQGSPGSSIQYHISQRFETTRNNTGYLKLREKTPIIGVWNDHDYGKNNGDRTFSYKAYMQNLYLNFLDEPAESVRRSRNGIYQSYYLGNDTRVKVILLDVRYFREESNFFRDDGKDILGDEQWKWLEQELKENKAEFLVIGSGCQIFPDDRLVPEHWHRESQNRLIGLLRKYKIGGVILISGDVEYAEIMRYPCKERVGFELYEFTSSGLSHSVLTQAPVADKFIEALYPRTWNTPKDMYFQRNFGVLKFNFGEEKGIKLEARSEEGKIVLEKFIPYEELKFDEKKLDDRKECVLDVGKGGRFAKHYWDSLVGGGLYMWCGTIGILGFVGMVLFLFGWCGRLVVNGLRKKKEEVRPTAEKEKTE